MSDQPTEKHEFNLDVRFASHHSLCVCGKRADAEVHQPSAVQAPEQATPRNRDWYVSDGLIIRDADDNEVASVQLSLHDNVPAKQRAELIVLAVNNYEAQAVRIAELEEALKVIRKDVAVVKRALWAEEVSSAAILHDIDRTDSASSAADRIRLLIATVLAARDALKPKRRIDVY